MFVPLYSETPEMQWKLKKKKCMYFKLINPLTLKKKKIFFI